MKKTELAEKTAAYRAKVELASAWTDDTDALECIELFPKWEAGRPVIVGERLQYEGKLYKCLQEHTTQADWTPDKTPALWKQITLEEFPEWKQPGGAADAYRLGEKVSHNGKHWICTYDYNAYEPGVYGWDEV